MHNQSHSIKANEQMFRTTIKGGVSVKISANKMTIIHKNEVVRDLQKCPH